MPKIGVFENVIEIFEDASLDCAILQKELDLRVGIAFSRLCGDSNT